MYCISLAILIDSIFATVAAFMAHRHFYLLVLSILFTLQFCSLPANCQIMPESTSAPVLLTQAAGKSTEDPNTAVQVSFPAALPVIKAPAPLRVLNTIPLVQANSGRENLMVTRMNGEVHFKHLGGPRLEPSRALNIETGAGMSWCEFKMNNCIGRVSKDSQVTVFPDTGAIYLNKGAIIVRISGNDVKYSVISGDLLCRVQSTTLRVQKTEKTVSYQVLEGTVTVCNRLSGEVFTAAQVVQPVKF